MITAFIPARIGSKRLPMKNLQTIGGETLIEHAVNAASASKYIDEIIVSIDDSHLIPRMYDRNRVTFISRSKDVSTDDATTESVILEYIDRFEKHPPWIVLLQPTSPLRTVDDIDAVIKMALLDGDYDSVFTAYRDRFLEWVSLHEGKLFPGYYVDNRPCGNNVPKHIIENGAVYMFRTEILKETGARLGGKIGVHFMPKSRSIDIDTEEDLMTARAIHREMNT